MGIQVFEVREGKMVQVNECPECGETNLRLIGPQRYYCPDCNLEIVFESETCSRQDNLFLAHGELTGNKK